MKLNLSNFLPRTAHIQFKACFLRYLRQTFANPWIIVPALLEAPFMLLIVAFIYEDQTFIEPTSHVTPANVTLFLLALASALMGLLGSYREICKERPILTREVFGGLNITSYLGAKITVLAILALIQSFILTGGSHIFIDYGFDTPFGSSLLMLITLFMVNMTMSATGLYVSALLKKSESAILPVLVIIVLQVAFSGALIQFSAPANYLTFITPTMYGTSILGNLVGMNAERTIRDIYDYNIWACLAILLLFCFLAYVLTFVKLKHDYKVRKD